MTKVLYSIDGEEFLYSDFEDLLYQLDSEGCLEPGEVYYEADAVELTIDRCLDIDNILDQADDVAYDFVGELYDSEFSDVSEDAKKELLDLMTAWAKKHVSIAGYLHIVGKIRERTITVDDLSAL